MLGRERTASLVLFFLLVGVLVPTASVLWFLNETARRDAEEARARVLEAYRGQLPLIRGRIDSFWSERGTRLAERGRSGPAGDFARIVTTGLADSIVLLDGRGLPAYPSATASSGSDTGDASSAAARDARAAIRARVRAGDRERAVREIERQFSVGAGARGVDDDGRLIAADELLLALQLLKRDDARFARVRDRLTSLLNDYAVAMPSAQRLFLMNELGALIGQPPRDRFPTYEAERLAATFLDTDTLRLADPGFQRSRVPDVWTFAPGGARVVALYRTGTILARLQSMLDAQNSPDGAQFAVRPPGHAGVEESIAAGTLLPDWRISLSLAEARPLPALARRRVAAYAWAGSVVIAVIVTSALLIGRSFQRQLRLARLKTDLVAAVSHELRTPLSSMRLLVDSLLDDAAPDPQKTREYLELIGSENLRLSRLIDNFLTFSRIERRRPRLDFAEIEPAAIVTLATAAMKERLRAPACRFTVEIERDLPPVRADEHALVTALLNLLDNAWKYTSTDKAIALHAYRDRSLVVFAVRDNGIGIAAKEQKKIFRRFYQVDRRLARERGGCGLGLSIVEFIARAHGGRVTVTSESGAGSTFLLSLPCRRDARGAAA